MSAPPQCRVLTAYATIAQTVQNVGINVPEKWSSRAMCARTAGIMTDGAGIYGDANVIGIKSRINMRREKEKRFGL